MPITDELIVLTDEQLQQRLIDIKFNELKSQLKSNNYFDVCLVSDYIKALGIEGHPQQKEPFFEWHCIHYKDMPDGTKEALWLRVQEFLNEQIHLQQKEKKRIEEHTSIAEDIANCYRSVVAKIRKYVQQDDS